MEERTATSVIPFPTLPRHRHTGSRSPAQVLRPFGAPVSPLVRRRATYQCPAQRLGVSSPPKPSNADLESRLQALEAHARHHYRSLFQKLQLPHSRAGIGDPLENRFVAHLHLLGFDAALAMGLFRMAASSWRFMGAFSPDAVFFHPAADRLLGDVRQGLIRTAEKSRMPRSCSGRSTPAQFYLSAMRSMDPANLFTLLEAIPTPWIILPRSYPLLQPGDARFFPVYLKWINKENRHECLRVFLRVLIEFTANFALKFADVNRDVHQLKDFVIHGYMAMFYKNLRLPPRGWEEAQVFDPFFNWLKFSSAAAGFRRKHPKTLAVMGAHAARIFPNTPNNFPIDPPMHGQTAFLIALRHGGPGITAAVRHFQGDPYRVDAVSAKSASHAVRLSRLRSFFDLIRRRYALETKQTQLFILEFLHQLKTAYANLAPSMGPADYPHQKALQKIHYRIRAMIADLSQPLS